MPMDLPPYNYSNADDENLPPVYDNQQFMPASPAETNQFNPNLASSGEIAQWLDENVFSQGLSVDGKTGDIIDPEDGSIKGKVPTLYPRV